MPTKQEQSNLLNNEINQLNDALDVIARFEEGDSFRLKRAIRERRAELEAQDEAL